jgi:hypothetical protein
MLPESHRECDSKYTSSEHNRNEPLQIAVAEPERELDWMSEANQE